MKDSKDYSQAYDCTNIEVISSQATILIRHAVVVPKAIIIPTRVGHGETEEFGIITRLKDKLKVQH